MDITQLKAGMSGIISQIVGGDDLSIQLEEMGFVPGSEISVVSRGPFAGPVALAVRGTTFALRRSEASRIKIGS
ncbi:MAG: ferrous iron transport protein A [Planctomycetes bacterium]|nr:ferrous iron transport protein A [Planctomycetota bacterium]